MASLQRSSALSAVAVALGLLASPTGCGDSGGGLDLAGVADGGRCMPGETQSCVCLGGGEGTQTCRASGSSYGTCTGCGTELPDGISMITDLGTGTCGDCDGCCNGPLCVPFDTQTNGQCGSRGQACEACPGTKVCGAGTGECLDATGGCGACTNGCCKNNVCLQNQPAACGSACTACTYGVTCATGACTSTIDMGAMFKVYVKSAKTLINNTNCSDNWDNFSAPDLLVCVGYQSGGSFYEVCNTHASDSFTATWGDAEGLVQSGGTPLLIPATILAQGKLRISLYDYEPIDANDLMAQGYFPMTTMKQSTYSTGAFGCALDIVFELR